MMHAQDATGRCSKATSKRCSFAALVGQLSTPCTEGAVCVQRQEPRAPSGWLSAGTSASGIQGPKGKSSRTRSVAHSVVPFWGQYCFSPYVVGGCGLRRAKRRRSASDFLDCCGCSDRVTANSKTGLRCEGCPSVDT